MYDLNSLSLDALLKISMKTELLTRFRTTEWVVVMSVVDREIIMNHGNALIFLQGLIYGAAIKSRRGEAGEEPRDGWIFRASGPSRIVVG